MKPITKSRINLKKRLNFQSRIQKPPKGYMRCKRRKIPRKWVKIKRRLKTCTRTLMKCINRMKIKKPTRWGRTSLLLSAGVGLLVPSKTFNKSRLEAFHQGFGCWESISTACPRNSIILRACPSSLGSASALS